MLLYNLYECRASYINAITKPEGRASSKYTIPFSRRGVHIHELTNYPIAISGALSGSCVGSFFVGTAKLNRNAVPENATATANAALRPTM